MLLFCYVYYRARSSRGVTANEVAAAAAAAAALLLLLLLLLL
jgi:hypothetical protein